MDTDFTLLRVTRVVVPASSTRLSAVSGLVLLPTLRRLGIKSDSARVYYDPEVAATSDSEPVPTVEKTWPSNKTSAGNIAVIGNDTIKISVFQYG